MEGGPQTLRPKPVRELPPEVLSGLKQVRRQHINNLLAILDKCLLSDDISLTAGVCSVALAALDLERYHALKIKTVRELPSQQLRIATVVNAITEVVLRQQLPRDQIRRQLQQLLQYQSTHLGAEHMMNNVAMLLLLEGDLDAAHQQLLHPSKGAPSVQAAMAPLRLALCAVIRHQQWHKAMQTLWRNHRHTVLPCPAATPSVKLSSAASAFMYDERMWVMAASSSAIRDAWRECEIQLKEALNVSGGNTLLSLLLVHAYVVSGRLQSALQAAQAAATATPHDADAHALLSLVQQLTASQPEPDAGGAQAGSGSLPGLVNTQTDGSPTDRRAGDGRDAGGVSEPAEHLQVATCLSTLQADPLNQAALTGLAEVQEHCLACQVATAEGCLVYLDMEGVVAQLDAAQLAWATLARSCSGIATQLSALAGSEDGLAAAQDEARDQPDGNGDEREQPRTAEGSGYKEHVLSMWKQLRLLLSERASWWPVLQLQPASWAHASREPQDAETAQHVLFVSALMLGPESAHVLLLAQTMRAAWQQVAGDEGATAGQQDVLDSDSLATLINQGTDKQVVGPAWVDAALQQATEALTAESQVLRQSQTRAGQAAAMQQDDAPYVPNPEWFRPLSVVIPLKRRRDRLEAAVAQA